RDQAAALLSQTGCSAPGNPQSPAASLIPYSVSSPLWSDGASKLRYMALPDGATISVKDCQRDPAACNPADPAYTLQDEGDWDVPNGTVLVKTFRLENRMVETRLLVRVDAFNWWGYGYEWRPDQTDADLLPANQDGYERTIPAAAGSQTWHFPSRTQCLQCHTDAAGQSLGLETSQLNIDFVYPNRVAANELETLGRVGAFATGAEPAPRPAYPNPADDRLPLEARARSYLHANCAICHRPGGESSTDMDFRFQTLLSDTQLCGHPAQFGDLGAPGALRIAPGDPAKSVVSLRMHSLDPAVRMPRIGTRVVDEVGVGVIDAWIASLPGCQ
ncbi:MAG TPA: hypothetical protein VGJ84_09020, partial [Polyangiaceae bacterium]